MLIDEKNKEIFDLNNGLISQNNYILELENKINNMGEEFKDNLEKTKWKVKISMKAELDQEINSYKNDNTSLENAVKNLQEKIEKYDKQIEQNNELEFLKNEDVEKKLRKIENQRKNELDELKSHLEMLKSLQINNSVNFEIDAERMAYATTIEQLKNKINDLEVNIFI